jgi:hypothetical protein
VEIWRADLEEWKKYAEEHRDSSFVSRPLPLAADLFEEAEEEKEPARDLPEAMMTQNPLTLTVSLQFSSRSQRRWRVAGEEEQGRAGQRLEDQTADIVILVTYLSPQRLRIRFLHRDLASRAGNLCSNHLLLVRAEGYPGLHPHSCLLSLSPLPHCSALSVGF